MSAQAVLSMLAPAAPADPRGSSVGGDSGFADLVFALLAAGEEATGRAGGPSPTENRDGQVLSLTGSKASEIEPLVLPGEAGGKEAEPQVLPGLLDGKVAEPPVLPDEGPAKDAEPQVLPGAKPPADAGPNVLPGIAVAKGDQAQVLPDSPETKPAGPQILPDGAAVAASAAAGDEAAAAATVSAAPVRQGPVAAPAGIVQPAPPPLRPLAERTSPPLDGTSSGAPREASPAEAKTGATGVPAPATTEQPAKPASPPASAGAAPQSDPVPTNGDEARSSGAPAGAQAEAPAAARDSGVTTLSRTAIEATAQIAAQILRKLEGRSTRFEIALRPDELGRVDVKLDIDSEGRLAARLAFDNPAAATDLRGRADELRRQLEAAGFQLADDALEFAERDSGSSAFDRGQHDPDRRAHGRAFAAAARINAETDAVQPPKWLTLSLSPAGVDMKV